MAMKPTCEELKQRVTFVEEARHTLGAAREDDRLRLVTEYAFEAVAVHRDGILIDANPQYFKLHGYDREDLIGKQVIPLTTAPDSIDSLKGNIDEKHTGPCAVLDQVAERLTR